MKILHIINSLRKGGAETNLYRLLKYDNQSFQKKEVYVISFASDSFFSDKIRQMGHTVYSLDIDNKYKIIFKIFTIYKIIKRIKPDIFARLFSPLFKPYSSLIQTIFKIHLNIN